MYTERLSQVRDLIAANPDHFYMGSWHSGTGVITPSGVRPHNDEYLCRTTACIAGWSLALRDGTFRHRHSSTEDEQRDAEHTEREARLFLGLPNCSLFFRDRWPARHRVLADNEGDAKAAVTLIDDLISGTVLLSDLSSPLL